MAFMFQYGMNNYQNKGALIGNLDWFLSLFYFIHELAIVMLPIYALSFSAVILQKLMAKQVFGRTYTRSIIHFIQHFLQTVMIFGMHYPINSLISIIHFAVFRCWNVCVFPVRTLAIYPEICINFGDIMSLYEDAFVHVIQSRTL